MKKLICSLLLIVSLLPFEVLAAPPQEEVDKLLQEIGWTNEDLQRYFDYYEISLNDYETIDDLRFELGTPITEDELTKEMTREYLDALFTEFGDSVENYFFIEEIDASIDFYLHHDEDMKEYEDFLASMGLTEAELESLFNHFMALDEVVLEQEIESIMARLESYLMIDETLELSQAQQDELTSVLGDMMKAFHLSPKFFLVDKNGVETSISLRQLASLNDLYENKLLIQLFNTEGTLLLDMKLSEEMLNSAFIIEAGQNLAGVGDLAGELTNVLHDQLPDTASSFGLYMIAGFVMILVGILIYFSTRRMQQV